MKRKDFYQLVMPLTDKLYRYAFCLIPDDLQAEQLIIDSLNAFLLKERKMIMRKEVDMESKKETQLFRRYILKGILRHLSDIGIRRASQFSDQMKSMRPKKYDTFYSLEPKVRIVVSLRYEGQFTVEEIEEILQVPRYEVIEKIHNGRFLLTSDLTPGAHVNG